MWFLLIQIFFFMCLSAALGAALAWWWLRRRLVDVTETHAELSRQLETALADGRALKPEDIETSVTSALAIYNPPQPDFDPIHSRLVSLEKTLNAPDPEVGALRERMAALEGLLSALSDGVGGQLREVTARLGDLSAPEGDTLSARLSALAANVSDNRPPDLGPVQLRLEQLELRLAELRIPEVDLGPVHSGLARLDLTLSELEPPEIDLGPVDQRLSQMETLLAALDQKDALAALSAEVTHIAGELSSVGEAISRQDGLTTVHNRLSELDLSIAERIGQLETRIAATSPINEALVSTLAGIESDLDVVASRRGPDFEPLFAQLSALDTSFAAIRTELRGQSRFETLERRLASLQEAVMNAPAGDVSRDDLTALEDRLTSIEYGLSAIHHMLRSRQDHFRSDYEPFRPRAADTGSTVHEAREARVPVRTTRAAPPPRTARRLEAIAAARKPDDQANLLTHAAFGEGDDLSRIVGVGPILTELLHDVGVYYFWQIAEWSDEDVAYVDEKLLHFRGRIERDDWVGQARDLSAEPDAARRPGDS
ncbi:MAG: hypothetical protein ACK4MQ_12385 [Hyphomonas sp.]